MLGIAGSSLTGFAMDNMTRDDGWRFLIIGRRIERLILPRPGAGRFPAHAVDPRPGAPSSGCSNWPTRSSPTARAIPARRNCCLSSTS
jgi:hypothetical protein